MNKKLRKVLSTVLIFVMALAMTIGNVITVAAAEENKSATITKKLDMASEVTTPGAVFTFQFEKVSVNGETNADMPTIANKSVTYDASKTGTTDASGLKTVVLETEDVFTGITFPHAGEYVYRVTEVQTGNTDIGGTVTYSEVEYLMYVYVANGTAGTYIKEVYAVQVVDEDGSAIDDGDQTKVDPEPGQPGDPGYVGNGFVFNSVFTKDAGAPGSIDEDEVALAISKTTVGEYADKIKQFTFSITMENAITDVSTTYPATIVRAGTTPNETVTFTKDQAKEITLADGERIVFDVLPIGTKYTVSEAASADYKASVVITSEGTTVNQSATNYNEILAVDTLKVGEEKNNLAFTNTYDDTTIEPPITGIIVNNLPIIILVVAALGTAYMYIKGRSKRYS